MNARLASFFIGNKKKMTMKNRLLATLFCIASVSTANAGYCLLCGPAFSGNLSEVKRLLSTGVEADAVNWHGLTPLLAASSNGYVEVVKELLGAGARVNARYSFVGFDYPQADYNGWTALLSASRNGHVEVVKELLGAGADINVRAGARVNTKYSSVGFQYPISDYNGWTALMLAANHGHVEVARVLLEAGADANAVDEHGQTVLMRASLNGNVKVVKELLGSGVEVNAAAKDGWTALMVASGWGGKARSEIVELLLGAGAEVNAVNEDGATALIQASGKSPGFGIKKGPYPGIIRILLVNGANPDLMDITGKTAWDYVKNKKQAALVFNKALKEWNEKQ